MVAGILNIDKPGGMTSHDVVDAVRRVTGIRKVGHAGALDPLATGVLVICIGRATRVAEYVTASDKRYQATVCLGVETDTYDADGRVVKTGAVAVSREQLEGALSAFRGPIEQVPPMYSAVKQGGRPLHELARAGITVDRKVRVANVTQLDLTDWSPPHFSLQVACSAGTYVRTLAHDLGQRLGCGAHVTRLVRTSSGLFTLEQAVRLADLSPEDWSSHLQPMATAVAHLPQVVFDGQGLQKLTHGQTSPRLAQQPAAELARAVTHDGHFFALVRLSADSAEWVPHKVFWEESPEQDEEGQ